MHSDLRPWLTFSNSEGNFEGELTSAKNPSKSSLTVLGDKMSECASMISVSPRFFPDKVLWCLDKV